MKNLAVIQHVDWEGAGHFLVQQAPLCDVTLRVFEAWKNSFPDPDHFDGIVILGGGPNVNEEDTYPFLRLEKKWLQEVIRLDIPCLGMCLGHQLLAEALGATIGKNFCNSVGVVSGLLTSHGRQHPLFSGHFRSLPLFKWHGQAIQTPAPHHFDILMTSKECQVEAFSIKGRPHLIGVQFDNHAGSIQDVQKWCDHDKEWLNATGVSPDYILEMIQQHQATIEKDFKQIFSAFCTML